MEPVTLTIAGAVTALVIEASKEAGKSIVKGGTDLTSKLVSLIYGRFQSANVEGILTQVQKEPTETNKTVFSNVLAGELSKDKDFANVIAELLKQIKAEGDEMIQIALVDIEVEDRLEVGDVVQKSFGQSSSTQEAAKNIKGKSIKIGNINQEKN